MESNLILCPFDNGIRVMQMFKRGIYGAANGSSKIFKYLSSKGQEPLFTIPVKKYNTGKNEDTYKAHSTITNYISKIKPPYYVLGGDHSITYPIVKGLTKFATPDQKFGLIYFDAHYDMRPLEGVNKDILSSGNSFSRILNDKNLPISGNNMAVIGIKKGTSKIFKHMDNFAKKNKVTVFYLDEINKYNHMSIMKQALKIAGNGTCGIYLSFDIDGVNSKYAPGASCPTPDGLNPKFAIDMLKSGKFIAGDMVEASNRERSYLGIKDPKGEGKLETTAKTAAEIIKSVQFNKLI